MTKTVTGIAIRFFKENKLISMTSIIGVMVSVSLIITIVVSVSNARQLLLLDHASHTELSNLDLLYQYTIGLSILVIIITALFIISNFELFLYKYKHQFAILRSLGASRVQVFHVILLQSFLIIIFGGLFAVLFSFITYNYSQRGIEIILSIELATLSFDFQTALIVACISVIALQLCMLLPAYKSSRLLPVTIMQENEEIDFLHTALIKKISFIILGISLFFIMMGVIFTKLFGFILVGSIGFLLSTILLAPLYYSNLTNKMLPLVRRVFGKVTFLALKNTIPQVRKNTFVISIISLTMIIAIFGSSILQSIAQGDESYIKKQFETEIVITNDNPSIKVDEITENIAQLNHVKHISTQSQQQVGMIAESDKSYYFDYSFADLSTMQKQGLLHITSTAPSQDVIVKESFAKEHGITIGDKLMVSLQYDNELQRYIQNSEITVSGIAEVFPYPNEIRDMLIDWNTTTVDSSFITFEKAYVEATAPKQAFEEIEEIIVTHANIQVNSLERALQQSREMANQIWVIFVLVLVVIMLSVMLGVMNTLVNNLNSKRKEFAVLRVIYMDRKEIIQFIMSQVTIFITYGTLLGMLIGYIFTYLIGLIDPGAITFNLSLVITMAILIFLIAYIILFPIANRLGKINISRELMQDNK